MNKNKVVLLAVILCGCVFFAMWLTKKRDSDGERDTFIVGTAAGYAPFVSINAHGECEGFDIDVAQALATFLDKSLVIKDLGSMAPLFLALEQGSIDVIIWGLSITEDRLNKVAMIRYQGEEVTEYPLIFWDVSPEAVKNINDMAGMTVSVEVASAQEIVLYDYPSIEKLYVERIDDALLNVQYGKSVAALVEPAIAQKFQKKYPNIKTMPLQLAAKHQVQGIGIAIKKDNTRLIDVIRTSVDAMTKNGALKNLEMKWEIV